MKNENIIIKTNMHICLTHFAIRRMHRRYDETFPINTLNVKVKVYFSQNDFVSRP